MVLYLTDFYKNPVLKTNAVKLCRDLGQGIKGSKRGPYVSREKSINRFFPAIFLWQSRLIYAIVNDGVTLNFDPVEI